MTKTEEQQHKLMTKRETCYIRTYASNNKARYKRKNTENNNTREKKGSMIHDKNW